MGEGIAIHLQNLYAQHVSMSIVIAAAYDTVLQVTHCEVDVQTPAVLVRNDAETSQIRSTRMRKDTIGGK